MAAAPVTDGPNRLREKRQSLARDFQHGHNFRRHICHQDGTDQKRHSGRKAGIDQRADNLHFLCAKRVQILSQLLKNSP